MEWSVLADRGTSLSIDSILKETDQGKLVCQNMVSFWVKVAEIEKSYADNLRNLLRSPSATFIGPGEKTAPKQRESSFLSNFVGEITDSKTKVKESEQLEDLWEKIKNQLKNRYAVHASESTKILSEVSQALKTYVESTYPPQREKMVECRKALQAIQEAKTSGEKTQEKCTKLQAEMTKIKGAIQKTPSKSGQLSQKLKSVEGDLQRTEASRSASQDLVRSLLQSYKSEVLPECLRSVQRLENTRIVSIVLSLSNYAKLHSSSLRADARGNDAMNDAAHEFEREKAILSFLERAVGKEAAQTFSSTQKKKNEFSTSADGGMIGVEMKKNENVAKVNDRDQVLGFVQRLMSK
eukprot:CAMPEP_0201483808 /NCGR_PEP_ID=MMETSP0151_2-20130828/7996_1 /ASSEMBLY_ACC=CAM_ASM_000257 /TAXON_ID=200890 /ORGANISM="Paramoeba atlantica, Strain 621/1 / CCAP 1560/9" /LENGTH=351 /DNA_ID=CAMNT_0047867127 /DNA_START=38 /DNA_END=1090 /DNA_ORIENTATION=+